MGRSAVRAPRGAVAQAVRSVPVARAVRAMRQHLPVAAEAGMAEVVRVVPAPRSMAGREAATVAALAGALPAHPQRPRRRDPMVAEEVVRRARDRAPARMEARVTSGPSLLEVLREAVAAVAPEFPAWSVVMAP